MARRSNERHVQFSASARCRAAAALFWPLATAVVLGVAGCASVDAAAPAMTAKSSKIKQAASDTPVAGGSASIIDGVFGGLAYANKESVCANSSLFDVEEFPGSGKFRAGDIARLQKSTVRLRFTHKHLAEAIFKDRIQSRYPDATNFSLGGFTSFAGKDEGLCSGTLIGGNIVSGGNTLTPTVNAPGTYRLVVTDNINGCTAGNNAKVTATIAEDAAGGAVFDGAAAAVAENAEQASVAVSVGLPPVDPPDFQ